MGMHNLLNKIQTCDLKHVYVYDLMYTMKANVFYLDTVRALIPYESGKVR